MAAIVRSVWNLLPFEFRLAFSRKLPAGLKDALREFIFSGRRRPRVVIPGPPVAAVELSDDPVAAILASAEYKATTVYFATQGETSLLSAQSRALLYQAIRLVRPHAVVEIGAHRGGTTEALARALATEGRGTVHAVEPFRDTEVRRAVRKWPRPLGAYVSVHRASSMSFFMEARNLQAGVCLVDGNHDYEYAAFDIGMAARHTAPGGFIFVDNVSQPGPFEAARDFLVRNQDFYPCGGVGGYRHEVPYDAMRSTIPYTDFMVLRRRQFISVNGLPRGFGVRLHRHNSVRRVSLDIEDARRGTVNVQVILRGLGREQNESTTSAFLEVDQSSGKLVVDVPTLTIAGEHFEYTAEIWLSWTGGSAMLLHRAPSAD